MMRHSARSDCDGGCQASEARSRNSDRYDSGEWTRVFGCAGARVHAARRVVRRGGGPPGGDPRRGPFRRTPHYSAVVTRPNSRTTSIPPRAPRAPRPQKGTAALSAFEVPGEHVFSRPGVGAKEADHPRVEIEKQANALRRPPLAVGGLPCTDRPDEEMKRARARHGIDSVGRRLVLSNPPE